MDEHRIQTLVVGGGSWGTALATLLASQDVSTVLWAREPEVVDSIRENRENTMFLPGVRLSPGLEATSNLEEALERAQMVVSAVPTQHIREVFQPVVDSLQSVDVLVSVSKGIEVDSLSTPSRVFADIAPGRISSSMIALSGPSFADEVAKNHPTAVVAASADVENARLVQRVFSNETFRVYTSDDPLGVELGGALKNVMAIAAGICDGLGFGHNTVTALIARGLAEITRLGVAMGGDAHTFAGLSGMGDLVLTCTGGLSRNRTVGQAIGRGRHLEDVLAEMTMVAEGVPTTIAVRRLAAESGVEMPISEQVYLTLFEHKEPMAVVNQLMTRRLRDER